MLIRLVESVTPVFPPKLASPTSPTSPSSSTSSTSPKTNGPSVSRSRTSKSRPSHTSASALRPASSPTTTTSSACARRTSTRRTTAQVTLRVARTPLRRPRAWSGPRKMVQAEAGAGSCSSLCCSAWLSPERTSDSPFTARGREIDFRSVLHYAGRLLRVLKSEPAW